MKTHRSFILFSLFAAMLLSSVSEATEAITVSLRAGNSYLIPPGQTTNSIGFNLSMTGLLNPPNNHYYGYNYRVDGGSWSEPTNLGFISSPYSTYFYINLGAGSHTVEVRLLEYENPFWVIRATDDISGVSLTQQYSITVKNSFNDGDVKVDGNTYDSGTNFTWSEGTNHTAETEEDGNSYGGYVRRYTDWTVPTGLASIQPIQINVSQDFTYTANFKKEYNITFQNSLPGTSSGGVIKVNNTQYNAPTSSFPVVQDEDITGEALYQVIDRIEYYFSSWSPGGSTSASTEFTPGDHTTYTANYTAVPQPPANVSPGGSVGNPIQITWSEHPNSNVTQYQIWRKVKPQGGQEGSPELMGTVNRGTTSYTDYEYLLTSGYTDFMLWYDVRSYFSVNGAYSQPNWHTVYGEESGAKLGETGNQIALGSATESLPTEYSVSSYPNPFNPSTTLSYQLVEDAYVTLTVYDVIGREIVTLVQTGKSAGYHSVLWNGQDAQNNPVSSGVYLYRFSVTPNSGKQSVVQSGKLLLSK